MAYSKNTESLDIENFEECLKEAMSIVESYIDDIKKEPVIPNVDRKELYNTLHKEMPLEGIGIKKTMEDVKNNIVPYSSKIGNPRFLSWIITSPAPAGTIGEIINLGLNQVPFCFKAGPSATVLEEIVLSWFAEMFGYSKDCGGILVSGGTMGTLTALTVAREAYVPGSMKKGLQSIDKPLVVYTSVEAHKSVETAVGVLGIGSDFVRKIPVNKDYKIDIQRLREEVKNDEKSGYTPFCVVAQAGTSTLGSVDDIDCLADFCRENNLWLHVDAAYAGGAILTERGKNLMKGIDKADSISTDPHKWFFMPVEAGCVLIKKRQHLYDTFKTADKEYDIEEPIEYMNYGIQFTRMSRAFKIWFAFNAYGLNKIARIVDQNMDLAQTFAKTIEGEEFFELLGTVQTSAVCFRYVPKDKMNEEEIDKLQCRILKELEDSGKAFVSSARLNGKVVMRACFSNHRTTYEDLDFLLGALKGIADNLLK